LRVTEDTGAKREKKICEAGPDGSQIGGETASDLRA